ncbi:hypothetical protein BC936DRAFT_138276 [Jimgerdemannia flammicorona]|uniref:USP domain-containing protein n=1 Tax=Jimgerdemannia flammicorona TaxID=994334 RepID=A0A433DIE6_9FUNG|nr:hypothetical protein BC936DRAFT_138276 [Jimgerdemannia flammicorona]
MFQPNNGRSHPLIDNDQTVISAFVRVVKDPTGVLWHNFINYDSKKVTGYVGLINQGTTSYLNAAVQCLYMIKYFRRSVYKIPTESDVPIKSIALALQRVFYNLQFSEVAVGTTELTGSFGWDSPDISKEHDFLLFNRILQENLASKMKNTPADGDMEKLFIGKMESYGKGISIDYEFSREEDYYDILLDVKGCKNLYESFVKYVAEFVEKQQIGGYGLQNVKKGVYLESFPSVLYIQLKRFEYDISRDAMHIVVILKVPEKDSKWFIYDDNRVIPVTDSEVFEDNYGDEAPNDNQLSALRPPMAAKKCYTRAYVLVYIRESDVDEMLASMSPGDIPPHIKRHLDGEKAQNEMHLTVKVSCVHQLSCDLRFL